MKPDKIIQRVRDELNTDIDYEIVQNEYGFEMWVDITPKARKIFGNIVEHAKQKTGEFDGTKYRIHNAIYSTRHFLQFELGEDTIESDTVDVKITFTNGVTVNINWSDEWGGYIGRIREE
jgi:hypothetical protein